MATGKRALFVTKIGDEVEVDSCLEESHTFDNTVTDHPVESGFNITDHSRPNPDTVTLRCMVSNTPLSVQQVQRAVRQGSVNFKTTAGSAQRLSVTGISGRGNDTYNKLQKLRVEGTLVTVVTTLRTYVKNSEGGMIISSISIPRTRQNYDGLEFSVTLKQIRIVTNRSTVDTNQKDKRTRPKKDTGAKTTEKTEEEDKGGLLYQGLQAVGAIK